MKTVVKEETLRKGNAIYEIWPYKTPGGGWSFDDDARGVKAEPFVAGADTFISKLAGEGATQVGIRFSDKPFKGYQFHVSKVNGEVHSGTDYYSEAFDHDLWLCPCLANYYDKSPEKIFLQFIPVPVKENK